MPNAAFAQDNWGGSTAPARAARSAVPGFKQYPVEQVLHFHERHLRDLMGAVGQLQFDASKNATTTVQTAKIDVNAIKDSVKSELLEQFTVQNNKIEKQEQTIAALRQEIVELRNNLEENVELVVDEQ